MGRSVLRIEHWATGPERKKREMKRQIAQAKLALRAYGPTTNGDELLITVDDDDADETLEEIRVIAARFGCAAGWTGDAGGDADCGWDVWVEVKEEEEEEEEGMRNEYPN